MVSIDTLIRDKQRTCLVCISPLSSPHVLPGPVQREEGYEGVAGPAETYSKPGW